MPNALPYKQIAPYHNITKHVVGAIADVDLNTKQYYCLQRTSTGTMAVASAAGAAIAGVLQDKPKAGEEACVADAGDTPAVAAAAIASGAPLMVDANGKVLTATGTNVIIGYAQQAVAAANSLVTMRLV